MLAEKILLNKKYLIVAEMNIQEARDGTLHKKVASHEEKKKKEIVLTHA